MKFNNILTLVVVYCFFCFGKAYAAEKINDEYKNIPVQIEYCETRGYDATSLFVAFAKYGARVNSKRISADFEFACTYDSYVYYQRYDENYMQSLLKITKQTLGHDLNINYYRNNSNNKYIRIFLTSDGPTSLPNR